MSPCRTINRAVFSIRSFSTGSMHGSFSRAETMNFMAAIGPDFKNGFVDVAPVSTAG